MREHHHAKYFKSKTNIPTLEPISRNIAIRRMNPRNKWVLSTNTDIILVLKTGHSLSELLRHLPAGHYCAPRFEIPESVWETFERTKPVQNIQLLDRLSKTLHMEEVVSGDEWNLYDAPGDFQLFTKSDIYEIGGFDETMLHGWHCDSNLNRRLQLLNGHQRCNIPVKVFPL